MNAAQARICSSKRKLSATDEKILNHRYDKILNDYISEIETMIKLYSKWGIWWAWIPVHYEPAIFLDAREYFEKLGFKYHHDGGVSMCIPGEAATKGDNTTYPKWRDQWSITWHEFD